jgi:spore maturation protein CgeB
MENDIEYYETLANDLKRDGMVATAHDMFQLIDHVLELEEIIDKNANALNLGKMVQRLASSEKAPAHLR